MTEFIKLVSESNWEALYADGKIAGQNHHGRVPVGEKMEGHMVESYERKMVPLPEGKGRYPRRLDDIDAPELEE